MAVSKVKRGRKAKHKRKDGCMGGLNENLVPKRETQVPKKGKAEKVRVHHDNQKGEIHFHDENHSPRRTVEVPVSVWYRVWLELQTLQRDKFEFLDAENGNLLTIAAVMKPGATPADPVQVEMDMDIVPAQVNDTFKGLLDVSKRQAAK